MTVAVEMIAGYMSWLIVLLSFCSPADVLKSFKWDTGELSIPPRKYFTNPVVNQSRYKIDFFKHRIIEIRI
jgi:hypothetical protein